MWMPGFSSCCCWKGGTLNTLLISLAPDSIAIVASGGGIDTVSVSYLAKFDGPSAFAAAISSAIAWIETFTAGSAMRSLSVRSVIVLMRASREFIRNGCELSAEMPRTSCGVPFVFDHSTRSPGVPPAPTSTVLDSSASLIAAGPLNLSQGDLGVLETERLSVLLDQLVALHDVELQVAHGELLGEADLGGLESPAGHAVAASAKAAMEVRRRFMRLPGRLLLAVNA